MIRERERERDIKEEIVYESWREKGRVMWVRGVEKERAS